MKNLIFIISILSLLSCKAQNIIKPMGTGNFCYSDPDCYEKDINNEFGKFVGTWKYTSGNTEITFKLKKEEQYQISDDSNFVDLLVGEYQYIENGVEKANTLAYFNNSSVSGYRHKISGGVFMHRLPPYYCTDNSEPAEIKINVNLDHPTDNLVDGQLILRYVNDGRTEKIEVCIYDQTTLDTPNHTLIPNGQYVFLKQ